MHLPAAMRARGGSSRMSESAVSDLPLPDSPTMPSRWPRARNEMPRTGLIGGGPRERDLDDEVAHIEDGVRRRSCERRASERAGSRTFWRLSPSVFSASTATRITTPGRSGTRRSGRGSVALWSSVPHEASGGWTPRPTKLRLASTKITSAMTRLARATSTGSVFGSSSRATIRARDAPTETAAR